VEKRDLRGDILIVDDTPANLRLLTSILQEQGFKTRPVVNGQLALTAAQSAPPDLILLDITMPEMSGYEVCAKLKSDDRTCDIPIIFISALDAVDDKVKAFTTGGVDYITKPFQIEEVLARVRTHIALRVMQRILQKANEELLQLTQAVVQSPASVVITDLDGNITYVNPQFSTLTGYAFEEALGNNPRILQSGETSIEVYENLWQTIKSGKVWKGELLNRKENGDLYWEHATIAPVLDRDGRIINFIAVKVDITELKRAEKALEELAATDPLTGLFNRRHFFDLVNVTLAEAARYQHPVTIMIFDLDHFKQVNDTHGHMMGDLALQHLVKGIRFSIRAADIAARFGGDEFVILLPETEGARAVHMAERLCSYLAANPVQTAEACFFITLSVGIASAPVQQGHISIDTLLEQADRALYNAKQSGRNRICIYGQ
jgi:two-component system, cell cycle response regulator